jgi:hypothetical protein
MLLMATFPTFAYDDGEMRRLEIERSRLENESSRLNAEQSQISAMRTRIESERQHVQNTCNRQVPQNQLAMARQQCQAAQNNFNNHIQQYNNAQQRYNSSVQQHRASVERWNSARNAATQRQHQQARGRSQVEHHVNNAGNCARQPHLNQREALDCAATHYYAAAQAAREMDDMALAQRLQQMADQSRASARSLSSQNPVVQTRAPQPAQTQGTPRPSSRNDHYDPNCPPGAQVCSAR